MSTSSCEQMTDEGEYPTISLSAITLNPKLPPSFRQGRLEGSSVHLLSYSLLSRGFPRSFKWEETWCGGKRGWLFRYRRNCCYQGNVQIKGGWAQAKNVTQITSWLTSSLVHMKIKGESNTDHHGINFLVLCRTDTWASVGSRTANSPTSPSLALSLKIQGISNWRNCNASQLKGLVSCGYYKLNWYGRNDPQK